MRTGASLLDWVNALVELCVRPPCSLNFERVAESNLSLSAKGTAIASALNLCHPILRSRDQLSQELLTRP